MGTGSGRQSLETALGPQPPDAVPQLELALHLAPPVISVVQHAYRVDWGPGVRPRLHHVSKLRACDCSLRQACPSVLKVREYLDQGGARAPDFPEDFWPAVPEQCPICQSPCRPRPDFNFAGHGLGWTCSAAGTLHYWQARLRPIQRLSQADCARPRWVFPPVRNSSGDLIYPGVTVEDVRLARDQAQLTAQRWKDQGYCPWE